MPRLDLTRHRWLVVVLAAGAVSGCGGHDQGTSAGAGASCTISPGADHGTASDHQAALDPGPTGDRSKGNAAPAACVVGANSCGVGGTCQGLTGEPGAAGVCVKQCSTIAPCPGGAVCLSGACAMPCDGAGDCPAGCGLVVTCAPLGDTTRDAPSSGPAYCRYSSSVIADQPGS